MAKKELPLLRIKHSCILFNLGNLKARSTWETAYVHYPFVFAYTANITCLVIIESSTLIWWHLFSCAKSIKGLCNLNVQIWHYRPRFSEVLRPLTLRNYAISILLYHWNKQALGDQSKITHIFYTINVSFSWCRCHQSWFRIHFNARNK